MKKIAFIVAVAMTFGFVACNQKPAETTAAEGENTEAVEETAEAAQPKAAPTIKDYTPSKALVDSVSYLVGINFGSFIKGYNFGDLNYAQIKKGMMDFINSKGDQRDPDFLSQFKISPEAMNELFGKYLENRQILLGMQNKEKEAKYLAANQKKDGVVATESGLQYKIIEAGEDYKPSGLDTVVVRYKGTLVDGTVFDQTKEDDEPATFVLNRVIRGWQEGMKLIGKGGKIELTIPSDLGYGESGTQGIEPNSTLLFEVELVDVKPFVEPEEETK